jgi:hypothetical protein
MLDDIIKRFQDLASKHPQNAERLEGSLKTMKAFTEVRMTLEKDYAQSVAQRFNLLVSGLEVALAGTTSKEQLLEFEISNVENILFYGRAQETLAIEDWSEFFRFDPETIFGLYRKLIKGQEFQLLFNLENRKSFLELSTTRALMFYKDYIKTLSSELRDAQP